MSSTGCIDITASCCSPKFFPYPRPASTSPPSLFIYFYLSLSCLNRGRNQCCPPTEMKKTLWWLSPESPPTPTPEAINVLNVLPYFGTSRVHQRQLLEQGDKNKVHMNSVVCLPADSAGGRPSCCVSAWNSDREFPSNIQMCRCDYFWCMFTLFLCCFPCSLFTWPLMSPLAFRSAAQLSEREGWGEKLRPQRATLEVIALKIPLRHLF